MKVGVTLVIGSRILQRRRKIEQNWVDAFDGLPVAVISDSMNRLFAGGGGLRPYHKSGYLCGPALTVRTRPGDNLLLHKALDIAEPGDVVVVDGGGETTNALIGELMIAHAKSRQIAGIVIYGAVRDRDSIASDEFPVYAAGVTHRGPYKDGPGEINVPVGIDGLVIEPGDLVVGDGDGVLSIPYDAVESIHKAATAKHKAEIYQMACINAGKNDRTWIDAALEARGYRVDV